ncbi:alpha/beta hydrolase family protein [uncultured Hymenobacter sp.]|uniref:alpha/beta hydrolase family protein n=1 Tax=uncultured Hymenobacter sp. TaxID=170016 RepID=UPI0035C94815
MLFLRFSLLALLLAAAPAALVLGQTPAPPAATRPAAPKTPADFGFRHLVVLFGRDSVDVLVQSPPGQEETRKPLLLWVQGSQPRPLIMLDEGRPYGVFAFLTKEARPDCHIVVIGKPGIPLVADVKVLDASKMFIDKITHTPPPFYCQRNYLEYYVRRNTAVLRYLKRQPWVDKASVTVVGHSEGSTVAAHLAAVPGLVSRAAYLSGNPLGRMLSNLTDARQDEAAGDTAAVSQMWRYWRDVVADPTRLDCPPGDANRTTYGFSAPPMKELLRARVPLFIGYGTRDKAVVGNDYLRLEAQRRHKINFTFRAYPGREHNFFGLKADGQVNYDDFYWDKVGEDFLRWAGLLAK